MQIEHRSKNLYFNCKYALDIRAPGAVNHATSRRRPQCNLNILCFFDFNNTSRKWRRGKATQWKHSELSTIVGKIKKCINVFALDRTGLSDLAFAVSVWCVFILFYCVCFRLSYCCIKSCTVSLWVSVMICCNKLPFEGQLIKWSEEGSALCW